MKLDVLPFLITKNLSSNMIGDYNGYAVKLYTEKIIGGTKGCIGFCLDDITKLLVPNTVLNYDIRKCTKEARKRIIATFRKRKSDLRYSELVYQAKKVDWDRIQLPEEYSYLSLPNKAKNNKTLLYT